MLKYRERLVVLAVPMMFMGCAEQPDDSKPGNPGAKADDGGGFVLHCEDSEFSVSITFRNEFFFSEIKKRGDATLGPFDAFAANWDATSATGGLSWEEGSLRVEKLGNVRVAHLSQLDFTPDDGVAPLICRSSDESCEGAFVDSSSVCRRSNGVVAPNVCCFSDEPFNRIRIDDFVRYTFIDERGRTLRNQSLTEETAEQVVTAIAFGITRFFGLHAEFFPYYYFPQAGDFDLFNASGDSVVRITNPADPGGCGNNNRVAEDIVERDWVARGFSHIYCFDDQSDGLVFGVNVDTDKIETISIHD